MNREKITTALRGIYMGRHFTGLIDSSQQNFTMPIRPYGRSRMAAKLKGISRLKKSEKHDDEYPDELWKFMSPSEKAKEGANKSLI
ncbi:MAG: hypothetical protein RSC68_01770 [Acinetobacter sp.]